LLFVCSAVVAFWLRFDFLVFLNRPEIWAFLIAAVTVKPLIFYWSGIYSRYWQYASVGDLAVITAGNTLGSVVLGLLVPALVFTGVIVEFSRSVLLIDFLLSLVLTGGLRFSFRMAAESTGRLRKAGAREPTAPRRVLIAGAGDAGTMVAREARRNPQLGLDIAGFVDDDPVKQGKQIAGLPVLGSLADLEQVIDARRIDEVVIAMPTAPGSAVRRLVDACQRLHVQSRTVPGVFELLSDRVSVSRLRDVQITDLLRRHPVQRSDMSPAYLADRVVLITGAGGSIGSELCRQVAAGRPRRLILLGHGENSIFDVSLELRQRFPGLPLEAVIGDVRDGARVRQVFAKYRPQLVYHAAAHKHVPLMEANPEEAVTNNVVGTARVLDAAIQTGTERFVLVSSDKAVSPSSIMGASKRLAEQLVHVASSQRQLPFVVVRFGNVLGSRGSVVPLFKRQIETGGPITITHPEMRRYFMTIPEAVHLILQAGSFGEPDNAYVLNMGDPVRVVDLAHDLIRLSGFERDEIPIVYTGLRPGEKLCEELWEDDAVVEATAHPDVFRVVEPRSIWADASVADLFAGIAMTEWASAATTERLIDQCRLALGAASPTA
jgi:FlaA1/EpsC-like NDP-sugar epimerase